MKKLLIILVLINLTHSSISQDLDSSSIVAIPTIHKDTLYLANNELGCLIEESWEMSDQYKKPVIIFKNHDWIIEEYKRINQIHISDIKKR